MPSLNSPGPPSGEGWSIPWKAVISIVLIGAAGSYTWYQYERLHPTPKKKPEVAVKAVSKQEKLNKSMETMLAKLDLTEEQKSKIAAFEKNTTDPVEMRRLTHRVLTKDQRTTITAMRKAAQAEAQAAAQLRKQQIAEKQKRMMSPADLQYAAEANKRMQAEREAKKKANQGGNAPQKKPAAAGANAS